MRYYLLLIALAITFYSCSPTKQPASQPPPATKPCPPVLPAVHDTIPRVCPTVPKPCKDSIIYRDRTITKDSIVYVPKPYPVHDTVPKVCPICPVCPPLPKPCKDSIIYVPKPYPVHDTLTIHTTLTIHDTIAFKKDTVRLHDTIIKQVTEIYHDTIRIHDTVPPVPPNNQRTWYLRDLHILPNTGQCLTDRVQKIIDSAVALGGTTEIVISDEGTYNLTMPPNISSAKAAVTLTYSCYPGEIDLAAAIVIDNCK